MCGVRIRYRGMNGLGGISCRDDRGGDRKTCIRAKKWPLISKYTTKSHLLLVVAKMTLGGFFWTQWPICGSGPGRSEGYKV